MSIGCNDLVHKTPHQYFTSVHTLVERLQTSFNGIKIILSEVTPRMDEFDQRVIEANQLLRQFVLSKEDLFLTKNSNLRNPDFFLSDGIHLNHSIIPRFASNIKRALRAAYGIPFHRKSGDATGTKAPNVNNYSYNKQSRSRTR